MARSQPQRRHSGKPYFFSAGASSTNRNNIPRRRQFHIQSFELLR